MPEHKDKKENIDTDAELSHNTDVVFEDEGESDSAEARIVKLKKQLKACMMERQEYLEGWQRTRADFVNARKEDETRRGELKKFAHMDLVERLLPVLDSFDMAFRNTAAWEQVEKVWRDGVMFIHSQFLSALKESGVEIIDPKGEKFDPTSMAALEIEPTDTNAEDDRVAEVFQRGYRMGTTVIRPAKVKIFSAKK